MTEYHNSRPFHSAYYLPFNEYPYYGYPQYPPPYSQRSFPPPILPKQHFPPHVSHPLVSSTHPSSLRRRPSRHSSIRLQRQMSNIHIRATSLRRTSTKQPPAFPVSGAFSSIQLARGRPYEWRSGYKPPSKSYFRRHFESFVAPYTFTTARSCMLTPPIRLHYLLVATHADLPNIFYDLRQPRIKHAVFLPYLNRLPNAIDFSQLITSPPIHRMTLWHRKLPWQINIEARQPNGITIHDFFRQIHQQLHQPIAQEEYFTDELTPSDREMLIMAFQARCALFPEQLAAGVRRIDFLGQEVCFIGLKRPRGERWEFKTRLPPPKERMIID